MTDDTRWIARLTPVESQTIEALFEMGLPLDVWERHHDHLVVAATAAQLQEIERRQLARVVRLETVSNFLARQPPQREP